MDSYLGAAESKRAMGRPPAAARIRGTRAVGFFGVLVICAIIVATAAMLWDFRRAELARAERELSNLGYILAEQTSHEIEAADLALRGARDRLQEGRASGFMMGEEALHTLFQARIAGIPQLRSLFLLDAEGKVVAGARDFPARRIWAGDREYFRVHEGSPNPDLHIDKPTRSRLDGEWAIQMSRRVNRPDGRFQGVIVATVNPEHFMRMYGSIRLGEGGEVSLFLRDGTLLAGEPLGTASLGQSFADSPVFRALDRDPAPGGKSGLLRVAASTPRMVAYRELDDFPLVMAVAMDESAVLAAWEHQTKLVVAGALGVIVVLGLATIALRRELAREDALTAALREGEARLSAIVTSAMDAIVTIDREQRIIFFNPAAEKMFGWRAHEVAGEPLDKLLPERFRGSHRRYVEHFGKTGETLRALGRQIELWGLRANGEEFPVEVSISHKLLDGDRFYTAIVRDISRRRETEEELRQSHQELRELAASLQTVREEERTRIARELHDELGQHLTGLKMDLSWIGSRLKDEQGAVAAKIQDMKALIDATVASMRRISSELRPLVLDDLGLTPALEWLASDFSARTGIEVGLHADAETDVADLALATAVFRIVQESLTNVARHAQAKRVDIALKDSGETMTVRVSDDGRGMPPEQSGGGRTFGLIGIRERALMFGGQARILSRPGEGTIVEVAIPTYRTAMRERKG